MDKKACEEKLLSHQVRPTANRELVLRLIAESDRAVSLSDIEAALETVDKSTIFRSLNVFLAHHVVHDIEDGSGSLKYEACTGEETCSIDDMHTHFYCEVCHHTFCFRGIHIPVVHLPEGFEMHGINYMVKGICRECARKEAGSKQIDA